MSPTTKQWEQLGKFQRHEQKLMQQYRVPNQGITSVEEIEYILVNGEFEERINRSSKKLKKREYFNNLEKKTVKKSLKNDPEEKTDKIGRKALATKNSKIGKLFGAGELIDVQLPDEDCNISGW